jgi:OmpA-OmpF porin, OOP family
MFLSVLLHVILFFALDHVKIVFGAHPIQELSTGPIHVREIEVQPMEIPETRPPDDAVIPPTNAASLLEEVDLLDLLPKDQELDIKPDIKEAEYAIKMASPAASGDPAATALEITSNLEVQADLPELGRREESLPPAAVGQITVDFGSVKTDDVDLTKFTDDLVKKGANGKIQKGALDGVASLDDLLGLPPNELIGKKTLLPSDLLFEFNSAELRESAKVGLFTLGLLIDKNPNLYCWIEGHTDLIGGDAPNLELSRRRAESVRNYLVKSMRYDGDRIIARGFGRSQPLVTEGNAEQQAPNRRVEIRMRKTPPLSDGLSKAEPAKRAPVVEEAPPAKAAEPAPVEPPKAVLVKPMRAYPVEEVVPTAKPVPEPPAPVEAAPRATQVPEPVQKAVPVEEEPAAPAIPRAEPVQE